jgi:hypothetical protein
MITEIFLGIIALTLGLILLALIGMLAGNTSVQKLAKEALKQAQFSQLDDKLNKLMLMAVTISGQIKPSVQQILIPQPGAQPTQEGRIFRSTDGKHSATSVEELMEKMDSEPAEEDYDMFKEQLEAEIDDDDDVEDEDEGEEKPDAG